VIVDLGMGALFARCPGTRVNNHIKDRGIRVLCEPPRPPQMT
jgi:hypothetical protein